MSTLKISNNEARVPFFGHKMSFITGLDPVGLQNPSSRAYSYLLNGLNVVSSRVRNYGFYSWLLKEYSRNGMSKDPNLQKDFFRRAEYILALGSVVNGLDRVSGSLHASKIAAGGQEDFVLTKGIYNTEGGTSNTYWAFPFGVFGQYYLGSMRAISLIEEVADDSGKALGIYRITRKSSIIKVSGEDLAEAFAEKISESNKSLFFSCIKNNLVSTGNLKELFPEFDMFKIPVGSREELLLTEMIMGADRPSIIDDEDQTFNRRNTFLHVLKFAQENPENLHEHSFTRNAYVDKGQHNQANDDTLFGWYYYQFNEFFRLACTACLNGILEELEIREGWTYLPAYIDDCANGILAILQKEFAISDLSKASNLMELKLPSEKEVCDQMLGSKDLLAMSLAFQLLLKLYQENNANIKSLQEYVGVRAINSEYDVLTFYSEDFPRLMKGTTLEFLKAFLLHQVVYRHQSVAYRKMSSNQSTQKFIIEDNYVRHIGNFPPAYTASRIGTVIGFMKDLHMIGEGNQLATKAKTLLKESQLW